MERARGDFDSRRFAAISQQKEVFLFLPRNSQRRRIDSLHDPAERAGYLGRMVAFANVRCFCESGTGDDEY
jgi:hypothetical protein